MVGEAYGKASIGIRTHSTRPRALSSTRVACQRIHMKQWYQRTTMASAGRPTDGRSYSCNGWWGPRTEPTNYRPEGEWPGTSRPAGSGSERTKLRRLQRRETKAWENQPIGQRKWQPLRERSMDCVHSRIYEWIVALRQAEHALRQVTNTLHILTTEMQMKWQPQTSRVWRMPAHRQELNSIAVEPTIVAKLDRTPLAPPGLEKCDRGNRTIRWPVSILGIVKRPQI